MQNRTTPEVRVTAKTTDIALKEAASLLKAQPSDIDYRVVSQTNGGFFSFLAKKVEIAAWIKGKTITGAMRKNGAELDNEELSPSEMKSLTEDLRKFCAGLCERMSCQEVKVTAELEDQRLILNIEDEFMSVQIAKNSKLAESLEHILRKKPRHLKRELPFRIFVDVKGVRRNRENDLVELARDLSEKVHENKRPIVLNYKSSYDRKIIHMALDKDERVYTKSIGTGPNRKLMILPIKKKEGAQEHHEQY